MGKGTFQIEEILPDEPGPQPQPQPQASPAAPPQPQPQPPSTLIALMSKTNEVHLGLTVGLMGVYKVRLGRSYAVGWFDDAAAALAAFTGDARHDRIIMVDADRSVASTEFLVADPGALGKDFVVGACPLHTGVDWQQVQAAVKSNCPPEQVAEAGRTYGFVIEEGQGLDASGYVRARLQHPAAICSLSRRAAEKLAGGDAWDGPVWVDVARPCSTFAPRAFGGHLGTRQGELR